MDNWALNVDHITVNHVPFSRWAAAKEKHKTHCKLNKICARCSCIDKLSSVLPVTSVHIVA